MLAIVVVVRVVAGWLAERSPLVAGVAVGPR